MAFYEGQTWLGGGAGGGHPFAQASRPDFENRHFCLEISIWKYPFFAKFCSSFGESCRQKKATAPCSVSTCTMVGSKKTKKNNEKKYGGTTNKAFACHFIFLSSIQKEYPQSLEGLGWPLWPIGCGEYSRMIFSIWKIVPPSTHR